MVYILECADRTLYTGITTDLKRRLEEHNGARDGGAKYTRARRPVCLVYSEALPHRSAAAMREAVIKKMTRAQKTSLIGKAAFG